MKVTDQEVGVAGVQVPWRLFENDTWGTQWCVLWIQGFTSTQDGHRKGVERMAAMSQMAFATLDFGGHGRHPLALDGVSRAQQLGDVVAVFDELKARGYAQIAVVGGSFGGYLAALLSAKREVAALVLRAPAIYPDEEFELPYRDTVHAEAARGGEKLGKLWREAVTKDTPSHALDAVGRFRGQTFVTAHELDSVVSRNVPQAYFEHAKRGSFILIAHTEHSPKMMANPEVHFAYIEHWVSSILAAVRAETSLKP